MQSNLCILGSYSWLIDAEDFVRRSSVADVVQVCGWCTREAVMFWTPYWLGSDSGPSLWGWDVTHLSLQHPPGNAEAKYELFNKHTFRDSHIKLGCMYMWAGLCTMQVMQVELIKWSAMVYMLLIRIRGHPKKRNKGKHYIMSWTATVPWLSEEALSGEALSRSRKAINHSSSRAQHSACTAYTAWICCMIPL